MNEHYVVDYLHSCSTGTLGLGECSPAWQLAIIALLLLYSVRVLAVLRFHIHELQG